MSHAVSTTVDAVTGHDAYPASRDAIAGSETSSSAYPRNPSSTLVGNRDTVVIFPTWHSKSSGANVGERRLPATLSSAEAIMLIASTAARAASPPAAEQLDRKVNPWNILQDDTNDELPMARTHSLQRFLEKRRERMMERSPHNYYSANSLYVEGPSHAQGMPPPFA
ncbi:hypothetical protein ZIOFF_015104 [Zingiber officinale]|uniref:Uncharacterized protein n=1 Tax=Zingiber officinale TaxID=94328 RepID=A0A8J5LM63_ZINOF|nr:hypothetical protein ZIOFF_015104 [Zingiber officinale]